MRRSVDLPLPLAPTTPIRLRGATVSEAPSRTARGPWAFVTFRAASVPDGRCMRRPPPDRGSEALLVCGQRSRMKAEQGSGVKSTACGLSRHYVHASDVG